MTEEEFFFAFDETLRNLLSGAIRAAEANGLSIEQARRAIVTSLVGRAFDAQVEPGKPHDAARVIIEHARAAAAVAIFGNQAGTA